MGNSFRCEAPVKLARALNARQAAGEAMALVNSLGALGGFLGTFIVGWLNGVTGGPGASFLFLSVSLAGAGVCMLLLPQPSFHEQKE